MPDAIGLIPAAGNASRISGLPKYLLPTKGGFLLRRLYNMMSTACAPKIITNTTQYDMMKLYAKYTSIVKLVTPSSTMTETLTRGRAGAKVGSHSRVLFGMPDTYFEDIDAFKKMSAALDDGAQLVVGHFETRPEQRASLGMCAFNDAGDLIAVMDKQPETYLTRAWGVLAWRSEFWEYLSPDMPHVGYGIEPAIRGGLDVRHIALDGSYWDCGTVSEYAHMLAWTTGLTIKERKFGFSEAYRGLRKARKEGT
jgi:molybdopterin-guanine dinucleotide biosynthesis protein A